MANTRAAIRYAKAILELAQAKQIAADVNNDMKLIYKIINTNEELDSFILNPTLSVETKEKALLSVFEDTNSLTKKLFHLLFQNKRFEILKDIALQYSIFFDIESGIQKVKVTTATEMDGYLENIVLEKVKTLSDKKIVLEKTINPNIIGGFILQIGDMQFNASVAQQFKTLKKELSN